MKTAGIIAEYNPFHNGHRYLIERLREQGATHIVAVMSGHLVQRGEVASFSKWARAEAALKNGVDLIVELPSLYATLSAERFAQAAVFLLDRMGCVDILGFGSESGEVNPFLRAAEACVSPKADALIRIKLAQGVSYAMARQAAVEQYAGQEVADVLSQPNDILAVEYCKALQKLGSAIIPVTFERTGVGHDSNVSHDRIASASLLREKVLAGESFQQFVPDSGWKVYTSELQKGSAPCRMDQLGTALLFQLRKLSQEDFSLLPDVSEGLECRLFQSARAACSLKEFYSLAKTKRYAHSRLRRIALYAALGITKKDLLISPPYLRILGMNARGVEIAARMKQTASLPYGTSFAKLSQATGSDGKRVAALEIQAGNLFGLGIPVPLPGGIDFTKQAVIF